MAGGTAEEANGASAPASPPCPPAPPRLVILPSGFCTPLTMRHGGSVAFYCAYSGKSVTLPKDVGIPLWVRRRGLPLQWTLSMSSVFSRHVQDVCSHSSFNRCFDIRRQCTPS
jgi:hypothetical protein